MRKNYDQFPNPAVDDDHVLSKPWELWWLYVPGTAGRRAPAGGRVKPFRPNKS